MEGLGIIAGITIAYIILSTLVGVWSVKHTKDTASFMTAKNAMGPFLIGILMMSEFIGTGSTMGTAQTGFTTGISAAWNLITLGLGFWLYAYFMAPKFRALGEYTISGALARRYGAGTRIIVSLIMIFALTTVNVSMYTGGAATLSSLLGISIEASVLIIGAVTILNVAAGGIRGVGYANIIHATFKYLGLIITAVFAWVMLKENPAAMDRIPAAHFSLTGIGLSTLMAWTLANIGAVFSTQYVIQCISSTADETEAKKSSLIASVTIVPIGFLAAFIGIGARGLFPEINSVMAFPKFLNAMNPWLAGIVTSGIVASTFVTILACQLGATALIMKDFVVPALNPDEKRKMLLTRLISIGIGLLPIPFALFVPGLLKTIFFARALRTTVAVVAVFMFYLPRYGNAKSATIGLVYSVIAVTGWFVMGNPWGIDNIFVALVVPAIVMVGDRVLFGKSKDIALLPQKMEN